MCFFEVNVPRCVVSSVFACEVGEILPEINYITVNDTMVITKYSIIFKLLISNAEAQNIHLRLLKLTVIPLLPSLCHD
jgi:hypothetical protein